MHLDIGIMFTSTAFRPPGTSGGEAIERISVPQGGVGKTAGNSSGDTFDGAQDISSAGVVSTNIIDLGDTGTVIYLGAPGGRGVKLQRRMGMIENMPMTVVVRTPIAGGAVTIELIEGTTIQTNNAGAVTGLTNANILVQDTLAAGTGEDYLWPYQIVPRPITERYLALRYKGTPASVTAGRIEAGIVGGVDGAYRG